MADAPQFARVSQRLPRHRRSVGRARHAFMEQAAAWGLDEDTARTAELLIAELASNAVLAATGPGREIEVCWTLDPGTGALLMEVSDAGAGRPVVRTPGVEDEHGRGMVLVEALADEWGVRERGGIGKTVWARVKVGWAEALTGG
ncbi:ATP-binding protein [Streptomyces sp. MST-110588]|uniref:ATP-binding protein n=1 Tax=Streptomyces sp. MST-110588 TaxID=2833628 RepID=UPI0020695D7E|nr:ATP-binding protein [Streptomyces sp. MST-110588]UNO41975.1 ATP-binding protein [Streptomyces sp. MST-110588]